MVRTTSDKQNWRTFQRQKKSFQGRSLNQNFETLCPLFHTQGSLRSYDGNCNENVTLKLNFAFSVLRLFHVGHVAQNRRSALPLAWHEWFSCKGKEWKIYCCELPLSSEPQIWKCHVVVWQTTSKHCSKKRAARAARLFFFIQPIKSLIWRVAVTVAAVKS